MGAYEVIKIWHGMPTLLGYCDDPTEAAMVIERDLQDSDDNAVYQMIRTEPNEEVD